MSADQFNEDYFLHGRDKGLSLYEDYRWLPDMTIPMVKRMIEHCHILQGHTVLDFGCARGYVVRAFRELGIRAYGIDTSKWAIENADPAVTQYIGNGVIYIDDIYDWVIAKDVLEHVEYVNEVILKLMQVAQVGVFAVVPLAPVSLAGAKYIIPDYEKDVTHIHRMALYSWMNFFLRHGWAVEGRYRVHGIKDNWYRPGWERGNGFITARRILE